MSLDISMIYSAFKRYGLTLRRQAVGGIVSQLNAEKDPSQALEQIIASVVDFMSHGGTDSTIVTREVIIKVISKLSKNEQEVRKDALQVFDAHVLPRVQFSLIDRKFHYCSKEKSPDVISNFSRTNLMRLIRHDLDNSNLFCGGLFKSDGDNLSVTNIDTARTISGKVLLFGMLCRGSNNKLYLRSSIASIEVDLTQATTLGGYIFAGAIILVEGSIDENEVLHAFIIAAVPVDRKLPSVESTMRFLLPQDEFDYHLTNNKILDIVEGENKNDYFLFVSEVGIDNTEQLSYFERLLEEILERRTYPSLLVLMGNLIIREIDNFIEFSDLLKALGEVLGNPKFKQIFQTCRVLFIPGKKDFSPEEDVMPTSSTSYACRKRFKKFIEKNAPYLKFHFGSNPCNILHYSKRFVFFRHNLASQFEKYNIQVEDKEEASTLQKIVRTLVEQRSLLPFQSSDVILAERFSSGVHLYPSPHTLILGDSDLSGTCKWHQTTGIALPSFYEKKSVIVYHPWNNEASEIVVSL